MNENSAPTMSGERVRWEYFGQFTFQACVSLVCGFARRRAPFIEIPISFPSKASSFRLDEGYD